MAGNDRLRKMVESGINTFLISDDAAYSGEQIVHRQIDPILRFYATEGIARKPKFVLAIPFVTNRFLKLIEDIKIQSGCEIEVQVDSIMPTLAEILTDEEKNTLNEKRSGGLEINQSEPSYLGATVTYFDHRVADDHSFSGEVRTALDLSATKPYANERSKYFKKEEREFEEYKKIAVFKM